MRQMTFTSIGFQAHHKQTRRERFLSEMEAVVPWRELCSLIEPHYPSGQKGRPPIGIERMLRIYFLQQWFNMSDPQAEDCLYDSEAMRKFVGIDLGVEAAPDETTICKFRRLIEENGIGKKIFAAVNEHLKQQGIKVGNGTIVDATIITAPSSTKNNEKGRDPEMHQTKKGNQWYFGMKIHVGADVDSGVVHTVSVTPANVADITELPNLLREDDRAVFGDAGYVNDHYKRAARQAGVYWGVALKARPKSRLGASQKQRNRKHSSIRSRVEHVFRVIKCQFGYTKVRYKGLAKNAAQVFMLVGLANLYLKRRELLA